MNPLNPTLPKSNLKIVTIDLVFIALFASLGIATKIIIRPIIGPLAETAVIPGGGIVGGLYMMWPVMAYGLIRKPGAATATSLIQALMALVMPFGGNFGLYSFPIYLAPGLAIDGFFLATRHKACCSTCCIGASATANVVGTISVYMLVLSPFWVATPPWVFVSFVAVVAAISGGIGGFIANTVISRIGKLKFGGKIT
jgi:ABC-type thiamin/hydroxymethylpyrimidine transport system permease subunit